VGRDPHPIWASVANPRAAEFANVATDGLEGKIQRLGEASGRGRNANGGSGGWLFTGEGQEDQSGNGIAIERI